MIDNIFITFGLILEKVSLKIGLRFKCLPRKNHVHGLSKSIILINLYARFPQCHKDFLDNSSGGSFTHNVVDEAWNLLEKISKNTDNWDLDKCNEPSLNF